MNEKVTIHLDENNKRYYLVPPNGKWGYVVMASYIIYMFIVSTQCELFGMIYADFLYEVTGDKTYGISLAAGILVASSAVSGSVGHVLVHLIPIRAVGFIGCIFYITGSFSACYMQDFLQAIFFISILQGFGTGLITISKYSSFYDYFTTKSNLMMGICQTILITGILLTPYPIEALMSSIGFRKFQWILLGLAIATIATVMTLHPVERHMVKVYVDEEEMASLSHPPKDEMVHENKSVNGTHCGFESVKSGSYLSLAETVQVNNSDDNKKIGCSTIIDLDLITSYKYWSVIIGLAFEFCSDLSFIALIPALLSGIGFPSSVIPGMMTTYFVFDLGGRFSYALINVFYKTRNRYVFMSGALVTAILRAIFSLDNSYYWTISILGIMGYTRGFLQVTMTLSITEDFQDKFSSAFSIYFAICGCFSISIGFLQGYVKKWTNSDVYVLYILTVAPITCFVLWTIEFIYFRYKCRNKLNY